MVLHLSFVHQPWLNPWLTLSIPMVNHHSSLWSTMVNHHSSSWSLDHPIPVKLRDRRFPLWSTQMPSWPTGAPTASRRHPTVGPMRSLSTSLVGTPCWYLRNYRMIYDILISIIHKHQYSHCWYLMTVDGYTDRVFVVRLILVWWNLKVPFFDISEIDAPECTRHGTQWLSEVTHLLN